MPNGIKRIWGQICTLLAALRGANHDPHCWNGEGYDG